MLVFLNKYYYQSINQHKEESIRSQGMYLILKFMSMEEMKDLEITMDEDDLTDTKPR